MMKPLRFYIMALLCAVANMAWGADKWVETSINDLYSNDIFVIVDKNGSFALPNTESTNTGPTVKPVDLNSDKTEITSTVSETLQWRIIKNQDNFVLCAANATRYLYNINSNNGVRVGNNTNNNKYVIAQDNDGNAFLKNISIANNGDPRYIGVYNKQDWRSYTSINNNIKDTQIAFYKKIADANTVATPIFNPAAGTYTEEQSVTISCGTTGAIIHYTTDGSTPNKNSATYTNALTVSSTTTIKAIAVKSGMSNSSVATAAYTIINLEHAGTKADPYTVADARAAIDANTGITNVYATGIVSKIVTAYNSTYGNITYDISADGTSTSDQLRVYRGKSYDGENFISEDDIQVGDEVVVYGSLKKYNSTYEFDEGNQLVSLIRPVLPVIKAEEEIVLAYDATSGEIEYSIDNPVEGRRLSAISTADWISDINVGEESVTFTTTANESYANRTTTITLAYEGAESTKTVTVIQNAAPYDVQDGVFNFAEYGYGMTQDNSEFNENPTTLKAGNVTINLSGSSNSRYFLIEGSLELRVYKACTMTVSVPEGKVIKKIEFEGPTIDGIKYNDEAITNGTWTGSQNPVVFTFSATQKISMITVTYGEATDPVITVSPTNINVPAEGKEGELDVVYDNIDLDDALPTYDFYDSNGSLIGRPDWITTFGINFDTQEGKYIWDKLSYEIATNTGEARSASFKLVININETKIYSDLITINQEAYVAEPETKTYKKVTSTDEITDGNYLIVYEGAAVAFDGSLETLDAAGNTVEVEIEEGYIETYETASFTINVTDGTIKSYSGHLIGMNKYDNGLLLDDKATNKTHTFAIDNAGNANISIDFGTSGSVALKFNSAINQARFRYYKSGQQSIQLYKEVTEEPVPEPFVLTINSKFTDGKGNYFATISNLGSGNFVVPADLEVSTITIVNRNINKTKSFVEDEVIPGKDVAYYIVASVEDASAADALTFEFKPTTDAVSDNLEEIDNWLYPAIAGEMITAPGEGSYLFYKLTTKDGKNPGFYWGADGGAPFKFTNEHKAYLAVPQDGSNAGLSSIAIDDTTSINDIENAYEQSDEVYTISGVRVKGKLSKGVYIVNGKKQIVK